MDDEGQVIGYVVFSLVVVEGEELQWVGLVLLVVDECYCGQGIGWQLVYEGLDLLNEFGYVVVVMLGDLDLYCCFGFELVVCFDFCCCWLDSVEVFQVYCLVDDVFDGVYGQVEYSEYFNCF